MLKIDLQGVSYVSERFQEAIRGYEFLRSKGLAHSLSDARTAYQIIHHWKISCGEIFQKFTKSSLTNEGHISYVHDGKNPFKYDAYENCPLNDHITSVHDGKKLLTGDI